MSFLYIVLPLSIHGYTELHKTADVAQSLR